MRVDGRRGEDDWGESSMGKLFVLRSSELNYRRGEGERGYSSVDFHLNLSAVRCDGWRVNLILK